MNNRKKLFVVFQASLLVLSAALLNCAPGFYGEARLFEYPPPLVPVEPARATVVPISQKMSMAVFNFIDQTGHSGPITEGLPDALSTMLFQSNRFSLYDRGQLRHDDFGQLLASWQKHQKHKVIGKSDVTPLASRPFDLTALAGEFNAIVTNVDTVVIGAITEIQSSVVTLDYRVVNAWSKTVLYGGQHRIGYSMSGREVDFNREDLRRLVKAVVNAFPNPKALRTGQVLVQDGKVLTVNLGRRDKILPGLNALIIAPGEQVLKTPSGEKIHDVMYLAEGYVKAVYENSCKMVVIPTDPNIYRDVRVGDYVKFK
jgi:curli biogenesis system outer membrane secretion channel CsgG